MSGSSIQPLTAATHWACERANSGLEAIAPLGSVLNPQSARPSITRPASPISVCLSSGSSSSVYQTSALSMSDDGTASRRATLPSAIQANGTGGSVTVRSSSRRVAASITTDSIAEMSVAATRASCSATIAGRRPAQAAATSAAVAARAIAWRRWNELRVATATRSESSTTPTTRPSGASTGKWRIPRSSMSSSTSLPMRSAVTV